MKSGKAAAVLSPFGEQVTESNLFLKACQNVTQDGKIPYLCTAFEELNIS